MISLDKVTHQFMMYGKDVEAIYLYGSAARGEQDEFSDLDLLIVSELDPFHLICRVKDDLGICIENEVEIISKKQLTTMFETGSDLAWTIYQEAKLLFCQSNHVQCPQPNKHIITKEFLASQYQKLKSSASALNNNDAVGFECIQIYSAIRRVYISLHLQLNLYGSDKAVRGLNSFSNFDHLYQDLRSFVRQGKAGLRKKLPSREWIFNTIRISTNWISNVAKDYGISNGELQSLITYNERAFKARNHYRQVLEFYSKEFQKLPPPFTLSNTAIDAWCKDAYDAGYDRSIELYRFSVGDLIFRQSDTLSRIYDTLSECGIPTGFDRYSNLVLDY
ncbi:nucleotidyltransferase [Pseudomonas syringae pv. lapsa]|uniref:Nucleotidyltransferase domain protein n=1 Tax=Pseudomonas syringae pv. lapsa TaxID=199201 RepID=A0AB74AAB9_PSESX|nr:nucleotidyltransferase domain-containing protein [Pseudomonas syringae]ALU62486.1 nucleotidyltransferase [Pseudomonas syringae pv. lapsa]KPX65321.1 Nucleotidyltransferase domain protein [Pseudomonas syringae pv. lapsa]RML19762.1 Nucleotidyltransferase domain protein [Pseudomonas syringae pv. lapsa]RML27945.1 Nucleotidyltransferase domain protein [Pseudomonas syringae pv. lapsa]